MSLAFRKRFPVGEEGQSIEFSFYRENADNHRVVNFTIESNRHDPIVMLKNGHGEWRFLEPSLVPPAIAALELAFADALSDYGA